MNRWAWALLGIAILAIALRSSLLFLLALFLAFIAGATLLWARVCLTGVSYRRRFGSQRLFHGEETDLYVEIVNAKPLPLAWLHIADEFPRALTVTPARTTTSHRPGRQRLTNLVSLRWYERVTRRYRVHGAVRGAWTFGPAELSSGDIFGFALRRATAPDLDVLLVYPRTVPLTALGLPADRPFGEYRALRRLAEDPLRMNGARAYAPGDTLRTIHWKATARRGELHTKTFDAAAAQPLALFLNVNTFEQIWEGVDSDLLEYAISATASIARWAWERGQPVGLYANSVAQPGARLVRVRPAGHPDQLTLILEALARVVALGSGSIDDLLLRDALQLPYGTTIVVVSAIMADPLRRTLLHLHDRGFALGVVALGRACHAPLLPGVRTYAIGGKEEWRALDALALA